MAIIPRGHEPATPEELAEFLKFSCPPRFGGGPLDPQVPTRTFRRNLDTMIDLAVPPEVAARTRTGRDTVTLWIIEDPDDKVNGKVFPSPLIRTVRGDVVLVPTGFKFKLHTIHWHGIEPTPMNDGVGHTSFEATSNFVYQFATNTAGTYFYHCHKNTVLHFEMGLYGGLIVDPPAPAGSGLTAPYVTGGPGFAQANLTNFPGFPGFDPATFTVRYDVEAIWVPDTFDSVWHELGHDAFMQACNANDPVAPETFTQDGILNDFRPDMFLITGTFSVPTTARGVFPEIGTRIDGVAVNAQVGQTVLIRLINADYLVHEYTLGHDAIVIASDGVAFGVPPSSPYSAPFLMPANTPFRLTSARRIDMLVRPTVAGAIPFRVKFYDWINSPDAPTPKLFHIAETAINVTP